MRALLVIALASLAGCTVSFDPAGQPCDAAGRCLAGYACDATKHCQATGTVSAGSTHGSSGGNGTTSSGSGATTGTAGSGSTSASTGSASTASSTGSTGSASCSGVICPAAQKCEISGNSASCVTRSDFCDAATPCASGTGVCLQAADAAEGICAQACDAGCAIAQTCTPVVGARGNPFNLCLDSPAPRLCTGGASCASGGLSCLPFDSVGAGGLAQQLPVLFCDSPVPSGLGTDVSCLSSASCASGLCASDGSGAGGTCQPTCSSDTDCTGGRACNAVEQSDVAGHNLRACTPLPNTGCESCGSCGPDAPSCATTSTQCALPCNIFAELDTCGIGRNCVLDTSGNQVCYVDAGSPLVCPF